MGGAFENDELAARGLGIYNGREVSEAMFLLGCRCRIFIRADFGSSLWSYCRSGGLPGALRQGMRLCLGQAAGRYWLMSPAQVVVRLIRWFGRIGVALLVSLGARWPIPRFEPIVRRMRLPEEIVAVCESR